MTPAAPCKGCLDRHPRCHSHCKFYLEFRAACEKQQKERKKQSDMDSYFIDHHHLRL